MNNTQLLGKNAMKDSISNLPELDPTEPYCGLENIENLDAHMAAVFAECVVVPNSWLPTEFHDDVRGGRTLARLNELRVEKEGVKTEHQKLKAAKARNIERLAAQVAHLELTGEMDFDLDYSENECDEIAQHRAECALIGGMINGGLIDADDLLED
jgi:hypothetical protein